MAGTTSDWEDELGRWLEPLSSARVPGHGTHVSLYLTGLV
jgi:hypothetical protein